MPPLACLGLLAVLPLLLCRKAFLRIPAIAAAGFLWFWWNASQVLALQLPIELEGDDILVQGLITDIPTRSSGDKVRFRFAIHRYRAADQWLELDLPVRLSWYREVPELHPGERWQLLVRLKRPRGFANPGGFDYERWLFAQGIRATGYVRRSNDNQRLARTGEAWVQRYREFLSNRIGVFAGDTPATGLLQALAVGERSGISEAQWEVLRRTGTAHLMAISGLHVGLVAGLAFLVCRKTWERLGNKERWPAPAVAAVCAIVTAGVYALLAGFQVPAQRALIMVAIWMLSILFGGKPSAWRVWSLAMWTVLLVNPLSVLSAGFWLSFGAVAWILYLTGGRHGVLPRWRRVIGMQIGLIVGLTPLLWLWFNQISVTAPLANLVAIPAVSCLVVPLVLLGTLCTPLVPAIAQWTLQLAGYALTAVWWLLEWLAALPGGLLHVPAVPLLLHAAVAVGLVLWLAPRALPSRSLGLALLLPVFCTIPERPGDGAVWLTLLDVGQGLAAVVETRKHRLLYDAGPAFRHGLNTGNAVVVPYLVSRGYHHIDRLVISHGDNDHSGGGHAVFRQVDVGRIQAGEPEQLLWARSTRCQAGDRWVWDEVVFEYLAPSAGGEGNNASCVLRVETADGQVVLLPGDIEVAVEQHLVETQREKLAADVLVAPHHGSRTSSSQVFVDAVRPRLVLFPVGYGNRFGFPKAEIAERYHRAGAVLLDSASAGAIQLRLQPHKAPLTVIDRQQGRYWR